VNKRTTPVHRSPTMLDLAAEANRLLATIAAAQVAAPPRPTRECPECDGHGRIIVATRCIHLSGMGGPYAPDEITAPCRDCDGTGEVEHHELCDCDDCTPTQEET
jgi:hypothetical protein